MLLDGVQVSSGATADKRGVNPPVVHITDQGTAEMDLIQPGHGLDQGGDICTPDSELEEDLVKT